MNDLIMSYPCVTDEGVEFGGEVTFRFSRLVGIEKMYRWARNEDHREVQTVIPDCCTIHIDRNEFNIKADYDVMVAKFKELTELYGHE